MRPEASPTAARFSPWPGRLRLGLVGVVLFVAYVAAGRAGLALGTLHPSATAIWAPTGLALAAGILFGLRVGPAIFAGALVVNLGAGSAWPVAAAIATGNTAEALLGAFLVRRFARGAEAFLRPQDAFRYMGLGGVAPTALAATVGVGALVLGGEAAGASWGRLWMTWWLGDLGGALIVAPAVLLLATHKRWATGGGRWPEAAVLAATLLGTCWLVFAGAFPSPYLVLPLLVWAGFRFGPREVALGNLAVAAAAVGGTLALGAPFAGAGASPNDSLLYLQAFMAVVAGTTLPLAGAILERTRIVAESRLQEVQLRHAEQRADAEAKFRALVEAAPDAIVIADAGGRIALVNKQAERTFGWPRGELVGRPFEDLVAPRSRAVHAAHLRAFLSEPRSLPLGGRLEIDGHRRDGTEFPIELNLAQMRTPEGLLVSTSIRDVSERVRREAERAAGDAQRRELDRLKEQDAFKTQFINTAAHELKTPLTPIKLQLHLLKTSKAAELAPEQKRSVQILERNVDRLSTLVQDVLDAARIQAGRLALHRRPVDLGGVAAEAMESFREVARGVGVALEANVDGVVAVEADAQRITQVLFNLLTNALKFTPAGGRVRVTVGKGDGEGWVRVEDSGLGMTAEQLGRLFRPFSQVHEDAPTTKAGTGLGLYISRGILEQHHGRIWAESPGPGQGAAFSFALPLTAATPVMVHREEAPRKPERITEHQVSKRLRELI